MARNQADRGFAYVAVVCDLHVVALAAFGIRMCSRAAQGWLGSDDIVMFVPIVSKTPHSEAAHWSVDDGM